MEVAVRMEKNAATVLAELREDHKNMALMLKLLELEANPLLFDTSSAARFQSRS